MMVYHGWIPIPREAKKNYGIIVSLVQNNGLKFNVEKIKLTVFKSIHYGYCLSQINDVICTVNAKCLEKHIDSDV